VVAAVLSPEDMLEMLSLNRQALVAAAGATGPAAAKAKYDEELMCKYSSVYSVRPLPVPALRTLRFLLSVLFHTDAIAILVGVHSTAL
jgi:hypothetical protein